MTSDPQVLTRDEVLLVLDTAMASIASARLLIAKNWPEDQGLVIAAEDGTGCPTHHANRAPSMPSFCLDCETDLDELDGVSAESRGGDDS